MPSGRMADPVVLVVSSDSLYKGKQPSRCSSMRRGANSNRRSRREGETREEIEGHRSSSASPSSSCGRGIRMCGARLARAPLHRLWRRRPLQLQRLSRSRASRSHVSTSLLHSRPSSLVLLFAFDSASLTCFSLPRFCNLINSCSSNSDSNRERDGIRVVYFFALPPVLCTAQESSRRASQNQSE